MTSRRVTPLRARVYSVVTPFGERCWAYEVHEVPCTGCCTAVGTVQGSSNTWRRAYDNARYWIGLAERDMLPRDPRNA